MQKNFRVLFLIAFSLVIVMLAWAGKKNLKNWFGSPVQTNQVDKGKDKYDPAQAALLSELSMLLSRFDSSNHSYLLEGSFTAIDRRDSANAMNHLPYMFWLEGGAFYCRLGKTETINNKQAFLYIDHEVKKMLIQAPKIIVQPPGLPFKELYKMIRQEGFNLTKTTELGLAVISVKNENHLSCKELSISYDTLIRSIRRIFMRVPDIMDHLNPDKETWITLVIKNWDDKPDPKSFIKSSQFIGKDEQGQWIPVPAYSEYDVIAN